MLQLALELVLDQEGHLVAYFSKKFDKAKNGTTPMTQNSMQLYKHFAIYNNIFLLQPFEIYFDHKAFIYLNS